MVGNKAPLLVRRGLGWLFTNPDKNPRNPKICKIRDPNFPLFELHFLKSCFPQNAMVSGLKSQGKI
jgi:hypothetical protein